MDHPIKVSIDEKRGVKIAFKAFIIVGLIFVSPFHTHAANIASQFSTTTTTGWSGVYTGATFPMDGSTTPAGVQFYYSSTISEGDQMYVSIENASSTSVCDTNATPTNATVGSPVLYDVALICSGAPAAGNYHVALRQNTGGSNQETLGDGTQPFYIVYDSGGPVAFNDRTRIIDFTPEEGTTTPSAIPVNFSLHGYINGRDIAGQYKITIVLHNIDQNVLLLSAFSPADIYLLGSPITGGVNATTSGDFYFATSTYIGDGNYRLNAILEQDALFGWVKNPFFPIQNLSHQFIVGSSTFIGNISQNLFNDVFNASTTATSTAALLAGCNPLGNFNITNCMSGMFIPDPVQINALVQNFRDGVLIHAPWGYVQRLYDIVSATSTTALPTFTASVVMGPGDNSNTSTTTISFDPGDMLAGGGALLESIHDPVDGKSPRDIFYPMVQLAVAIMVILTIASDVMGSHKHHSESASSKRGNV
jgi:hypothetical protein